MSVRKSLRPFRVCITRCNTRNVKTCICKCRCSLTRDVTREMSIRNPPRPVHRTESARSHLATVPNRHETFLCVSYKNHVVRGSTLTHNVDELATTHHAVRGSTLTHNVDELATMTLVNVFESCCQRFNFNAQCG